MIKPALSAPHADLLRQLPLLLVTAFDGAGRLWASALVGSPGFVGVASDPSLLCITSTRLLGDGEAAAAWGGRVPCTTGGTCRAACACCARRACWPRHLPTLCCPHLPRRLAGMLALRPGQQVGCLGMQLSSRRRVRANGGVERAERSAEGLLSLQIRVQQAYSNCPQYIQKRTLQPGTPRQPGGGSPADERGGGRLGPAQCALVAAADTFWIASSSGPPPAPGGGGSAEGGGGSLPATQAAYGCDISHRGGPPGFVQVGAFATSIACFSCSAAR